MDSHAFDSSKLAELVTLCFDLSQKPGVKKEEAEKLILLGKRLRGVLMNILTARFQANDQGFAKATQSLNETTQVMKDALADIEEVSEAIKRTTETLKVVDKLLGIAIAFL